MTRHFSLPALDVTAVPAILVEAARCWRIARDSGEAIQPSLIRTLAVHDCSMLAPVLDSLCLFFEAALGRPMTVGASLGISDDEHLLLDLIDGSRPRHCLNCPNVVGTTLDCALCSTRTMLALTIGQPARPTL